ncbi:MAG: hypothetical protein KIT83_14340 [Bryobacterales bacterium]|nr:hypothetical protein [Bryobacterales bacterium]
MGTPNQGDFQQQGGAPPPPGGYPPQGGYPPPQGGYPPPQQGPSTGGMDDNITSLLCYLPFLLGLIASIVFLVVEPYNKNALIRFHAFQSIFLAVALIIIGFTLGIISVILGFIPVLGWIGSMLGAILSILIWMGSFFLYLFLMYKAYNKERIVLPLIGAQAEKQATKAS